MPTYMDIHTVDGVTAADMEKAHLADLQVQSKYGVEYVKYWINQSRGKIYCLCTAPSVEAANHVHREAHGLVAEKIIEVDPELMEGLLGHAEANASGAVLLAGSHERDPAIRTILFTDIVGSTALTQRIGDDATMNLLGAHDTIVRNALAASGGREVKHTGDGIMASFVSAAAAVRSASQIQREVARYGKERGGPPLEVRIGAAAGEPIERHNDLFGSTVQLAARLCAHADPAQILVSSAVAELCIGKGLPFQGLGEVSLRGFDSPVRVHAVVWLHPEATP